MEKLITIDNKILKVKKDKVLLCLKGGDKELSPEKVCDMYIANLKAINKMEDSLKNPHEKQLFYKALRASEIVVKVDGISLVFVDLDKVKKFIDHIRNYSLKDKIVYQRVDTFNKVSESVDTGLICGINVRVSWRKDSEVTVKMLPYLTDMQLSNHVTYSIA